MKFIQKILGIILFIMLLIPNNVSALEQEVTVYLFYGEGCPHCADEKVFLAQLQEEYDNLNVVLYETWYNSNNLELANIVRDKIGIESASVPLTIIGDYYFIGYADYMNDDIIKNIENQGMNGQIDLIEHILNDESIEGLDFSVIDKDGMITLPLLNEVNVKDFSLTIIALVLGAVDGFNPCAMWILIFLISMLIGTNDKKKMWTLGLTFIITSALMYALIMVTWINVTSIASSVQQLRWFVAIVAFIAASFNLGSFIKTLKEDDGCTIVEESKRDKIINKIKNSINESRIPVAMLGISLLAIVVNLIELSCSAGLPLIFTSILAFNELNNMQYALYIFIYIFFFMLDDIIVFTIAMFTLKITGISTKYIKYNHIIGAVIMYIIAILLVFKPEWIMFNF